MSFVAIFSNVSEIDNPFNWKPEQNLESVPEDLIGRLSLKIEEKSLEEEIEFESIILHLALAYEHFNAGNVRKSREILRGMVDESSRLDQLEESYGSRGRLLALQHLLLSALTHVSICSKDTENARQEFDKIVRISSMDGKSKAALNGFRACFYAEYGIRGSKAAIAFAEKAVEMDPEESLWYFVKGKLLGRVRRVERPYDIPLPDELDALETACEKESNAAYAIFAAQVYRETANRAFGKHKRDGSLHPNLKRMIDKMNAKSYQLYEKSLSLKPHCSHIKFRCAKGFMALPPPFKNTALAKSCISEGLKMAPTSAYGNHVMATFYERHEKDVHASIKHLKICVSLHVFGAAMDLLRLEFSNYGLSRADILRRLDTLYENYTEPPRRCQILSQYVSYYLFVDYVLEEAIKYLVQVFRLNLSCDDVHKHRSLFLRLRYTISLLEVVVDETKIRLNDENCSQEMRHVCNKFLADLADLNVRYARNRPRYLRQACLRNDEFRGRASSSVSERQRGKNVVRGPSSANATVSYLRRRSQQAAADETLKKIDLFTNAWKKDACERSSAGQDADDDETPSKPGPRAEEVDDDDDDDDGDDGGHIRRLAAIRYERERRHFRPSPSEVVVPQRPCPPPTRLDEQRRSLAGLTITPGPSEERDLDFEKSVLAYRRVKQAAHSARASDDRHPSAAGRSVAPPHRNEPPPPRLDVSAKQSRPKPKPEKNANDDHLFDNYLARSTVEMKKKFQPEEIRF